MDAGVKPRHYPMVPIRMSRPARLVIAVVSACSLALALMGAARAACPAAGDAASIVVAPTPDDAGAHDCGPPAAPAPHPDDHSCTMVAACAGLPLALPAQPIGVATSTDHAVPHGGDLLRPRAVVRPPHAPPPRA